MRILFYLIFLTSTTFSFGQMSIEFCGGGHYADILRATSREANGNRPLLKIPKYNYGIVVSSPFSERASINLGLGYAIKGAEIDVNLILPDQHRKGFNEGYLLDYWQVPVTVRYNFWNTRLKVQGELGGYAAFLRHAYHFYPIYDAWNDEYLEAVKKTDGFAKTDLGIKAGFATSYEVYSKWSLGVRLFSEWGLRKVMEKDDGWSGNNWTYGAQVFIGYTLSQKAFYSSPMLDL